MIGKIGGQCTLRLRPFQIQANHERVGTQRDTAPFKRVLVNGSGIWKLNAVDLSRSGTRDILRLSANLWPMFLTSQLVILLDILLQLDLPASYPFISLPLMHIRRGDSDGE